ncbi:hypothetical protein QFC24_001298 [Naganishia onofrii]|uniref:Uncharacterized protein n=1 Tax=Naganishia onofrii TaxID=1851511 RepID=A0ACC2XUM4_9TREE|nr:hypothetical protein QFC24_001298 [Naganishia onofrii]
MSESSLPPTPVTPLGQKGLPAEYSPSRPGYMLDSSFWDLVDLDVEPASSPLSPVADNFIHSPGFVSWYQDELAAGNLDSVLLSDAWCAPIAPLVSPPVALPLSDSDITLLLRMLEDAQAAERLNVSPAFPFCSSEDPPLAVYDDSSDDEDDVLNVADIQRYYWSRGDVKFLIERHGIKALLTVEDLEERYSGVKMAI